jgi:hypothetical protein
MSRKFKAPEFNVPVKCHFDVDTLARNIAMIAEQGRRLPPAFMGAGISEPVCGPDGEMIGRVLDGKGLYLNHDLKDLGITKKIPFVYERSRTQRLLDKIEDTRGAITTYDGIIQARAGGKADDVAFSKGASITTVANTWFSTFRMSGLPAAGTYTNIPTGAVADRTNAGALSLGLSNPTGGDKKYLLTLGFTSSSALQMMTLVDLLVACGNIVATSNAAQTVSSAALTRYTSGAGVYATFEVTTAIGTTASNINLSSYTNQAGTAAQSSPAQAMTTSAIVQRLMPATLNSIQLPLASGDYGIQAVSTVTLSAAMSAGVMALNLFKPLVWLPGIAANIYMERDTSVQISSLVELVVGSSTIGCLTAYCMANTTSSGTIAGFIRTCAG